MFSEGKGAFPRKENWPEIFLREFGPQRGFRDPWIFPGPGREGLVIFKPRWAKEGLFPQKRGFGGKNPIILINLDLALGWGQNGLLD